MFSSSTASFCPQRGRLVWPHRENGFSGSFFKFKSSLLYGGDRVFLSSVHLFIIAEISVRSGALQWSVSLPQSSRIWLFRSLFLQTHSCWWWCIKFCNPSYQFSWNLQANALAVGSCRGLRHLSSWYSGELIFIIFFSGTCIHSILAITYSISSSIRNAQEDVQSSFRVLSHLSGFLREGLRFCVHRPYQETQSCVSKLEIGTGDIAYSGELRRALCLQIFTEFAERFFESHSSHDFLVRLQNTENKKLSSNISNDTSKS